MPKQKNYWETLQNEKAVMRDIIWMLRYAYGLWPDHVEDGPGPKKPGRPDITVMNPNGPGYYIEVKDFDMRKTSFSFSEISVDQRNWLSSWNVDCPGHSYIAFGETKIKDPCIYIVPWDEWLKVERMCIDLGSKSIPHRVGPGYLTALQENLIDIRLLEQWACNTTSHRINHLDKGWRAPWVISSETTSSRN